jgi:hypothetical protein
MQDDDFASFDFEGHYNASVAGARNVNERAARAVAASITSSSHAAAAEAGLIVLDGAVPARFRRVLPYETLNQVQSRVFGAVFRDGASVAVAAPTGTGKTALFELAIIRALMQRDLADASGMTDLRNSKVVYLAPLRALCSERKLDWQQKFGPLGINVVSVAGDDIGASGDGDEEDDAPTGTGEAALPDGSAPAAAASRGGCYDTDREAVSRAVRLMCYVQHPICLSFHCVTVRLALSLACCHRTSSLLHPRSGTP